MTGLKFWVAIICLRVLLKRSLLPWRPVEEKEEEEEDEKKEEEEEEEEEGKK